MAFSKKKKKEEVEYVKAKELMEKFKISSQKLYETLWLLKWVAKSEKKGWMATELGVEQGAIQRNMRGTDYVIWDNKIKSNFELINAINNSKEEKKIKQIVKDKPIHSSITNEKTEEDIKLKYSKSKRMTDKEKKEKGDKYEEYIASHFRSKGYYVWEHGKEKGVEDKNIDLFIKKEKEIYFVQCKNWETWKLDHNTVKATRMDVIDYLEENQMLKEMINDFTWKILYVTSKKCLTKGAYKYIEGKSDLIEYQVIPMSA